MSCKKCSDLNSEDNKSNSEVKKCFFHTTKDILMNNDIDYIKSWITELYNKYTTRDFIYNSSSKEFLSFYRLLVTFFPRLLQQSAIHKKGKDFVSNIANHILSLANKGHVKIEKETITTYIKYVKINMENINKHHLKEKHLYNCVMKQHVPIDTAIHFCYPGKKGKELKKLIRFYVDRERLIWTNLYCLPNSIVRIIINKIN